MNKHKYTKLRENRYDKTINQAMVFLRRTFLIHLKDPNHVVDYSHEVDLDQLDLTDYKYTRDMKIELAGTDLNLMALEPCIVIQEMEELLSIKWVNQENKQ